MSKSYNNTIPLFSSEKELKKTIMRIVTNSQSVEEVKNPETSEIFNLYKLFASKDEQEALALRYRSGGMGWGEAKTCLFEVVNRELAPIREKYNNIISNPETIEDILENGAAKARVIAKETVRRLREAAGFTF